MKMRKFLLTIICALGIFLLLVLTSTTSLCKTQAKIDSLTQLIKQAQNDKNTDAEIKLISDIIEIYESQGNWTEYEKMVQQLLDIAQQNSNKVEMANCYNLLGISNAHRGNNQQSLKYFNKTLLLNIDANDSVSIGNSYENIGSVYKDLGNYEKAVEYQLRSLNMRNGRERTRVFNNYMALTTLYGLLNNIDKQDIYIAKAREELQKLGEGNYDQLAIFNNEIAQVYNARGLVDSALSCYVNVVKYSEKIDWKRGIAVGKGNLAEIYASQNKYAEAIGMHWEVLKLSQDIEDCMSIAEEYLYLSVLYDKTNKLDSAIRLAEHSLERTKECELAREQIDALLMCANLYEKKGQTKKALVTYRDYHALYDSILNLDRQNSIAELETQFQTKEKEQQIELLNTQNEITLKEKSNQRRLFILILFALVLIFIVLYYLFKTKQKTHKALEKLNDLKTGFFNNVSHELRTPLTLIGSPAAQLLEEEKDPKKREYLELINRNSQKLLGLVNQLLDLSKIDAGFYKLNIEHADLEKLTRKIASEFEYLAQTQNINYSYTIEATSLVWFDPRVVETLLVNLLSNAFKYTNHLKMVSFELKFQSNEVTFCIKNSCDTISDETLAQIFDRFYRSDSLEIGSGIGLSLVKELIDIYRAQITAVYNSTNEMQIEIILPINKSHFTKDEFNIIDHAPKPEIQVVCETNKLVDNENKNLNTLPTLLIVEDNPDMQEYVASCFRDKFNMLKANNGQQGVELAIEHIPDLILSDVMMPVLDGIGLCNMLKNNQLTSHIPIILLTAKAGEEDTLIGLQSKASDYITKPFSVETLQLKVNNALELGIKMREKYCQELMISPLNLVLPSSEEQFAKNIQQVLNEHLTRPEFNVEQFCEATNLSRTQLHRKLTSLTGLSATAFIRTQRVKLAVQELKSGNHTISDICYQVGFNDTSYFSKCFKESMGLTPSDYIAQLTEIQ